jgi:AraC-like DNA-binding protein
VPAPPSVVLLIETSNEYARGLLRGIMAYIHEHERWSIYLPEQGRGEDPPGWLRRWHGDGIIARIENPQIGRAVAASRLPAVDLSAGRRDLENRFRKILGFTPHEEIVRVRIDRVKQLLGETDLPLMRAAQLTGFRHVEYLSAAFKKRVCLSPREYRRTAQA